MLPLLPSSLQSFLLKEVRERRRERSNQSSHLCLLSASMERHKCRLCFRTFANGRALGGHMKAHLAAFPLPPKTATATQQQLGQDRNESASSSYSSSSGDDDGDEVEEQEAEQEIVRNREVVEDKSLGYGLRENPKKSFRLADPEFSFAADAGSVIVQDRESETESRNPTRRRSKRIRKSSFGENQKQNFDANKALKLKNPSWVESSPAEPEPVSSVSDTSPEEDIAMCLMMLSRDVWMRNNEEEDQEEGAKLDGEKSVEMVEEEAVEIKVSKIRGKFRCEKCMKLFRSSRALNGHKRICSLNATEVRNIAGGGSHANDRIFECPYCFKVFGSGQALGGHKRSHLMGSSSTGAAAAVEDSAAKLENKLIDLNLPAPVEDDEFSVVSDA